MLCGVPYTAPPKADTASVVWFRSRLLQLFFGEKAEGKNGVGGGAGVAAPGKSEEAELGGPA